MSAQVASEVVYVRVSVLSEDRDLQFKIYELIRKFFLEIGHDPSVYPANEIVVFDIACADVVHAANLALDLRSYLERNSSEADRKKVALLLFLYEGSDLIPAPISAVWR